jgi:hypothetical protein
LQFQNYSNTTTYKTVLADNVPSAQYGAVTATVVYGAALLQLTSIDNLSWQVLTLQTGSTFTLYGIEAA